MFGRRTDHAVDLYARAVVAGRVPAGKYHKLACARHLRDRQREGTRTFPYRFDAAKADRYFRFAGKLKHYKGEWAGQFIELQPWQQFCDGSVVGWVHHETGLRRFRSSLEEVPRKNGKTLRAGIRLDYLTFFDGEQGAEGYSIATKREQAKLAFADAKKLVEASGLKNRIKVLVGNLHREDTASKLEPLGADHDSTDGLNPHVVCVDELHAMKDRGLLDVMETATGARRQPLIFAITTFGNDPVSVWGDQHDYGCKVLDGVLQDESFFVFIAHADLEDDWTLPETARKANPNYGISVNPDDLAAKVLKAKGIPAAAATYKQKHLNLLPGGTGQCLSVDGWRKGQAAFTIDDLRGLICYAGVDLASKLDLCALSFVFPPTVDCASWRLLQYIWTPEETLVDRAHRDRAPYGVWRDQGWLRTTPGTEIDHNVIRDILKLHRADFQIAQIGFDPWHAHDVIQNLKAVDGFTETQVLEVRQTYQSLSEAETTFQAAVMAGHVDARGCPVTAWAASNVVSQEDGKGNIQFSKKKSRSRIDPIKAATTAMSLALRARPVAPTYQLLVLGGSR
jgi:phage terminase large subunit-like protein